MAESTRIPLRHSMESTDRDFLQLNNFWPFVYIENASIICVFGSNDKNYIVVCIQCTFRIKGQHLLFCIVREISYIVEIDIKTPSRRRNALQKSTMNKKKQL